MRIQFYFKPFSLHHIKKKEARDEPVRGFAFLTGYNGSDKSLHGTIKSTTPFRTGKNIIIVEIINQNQSDMTIIFLTMLMACAKLSRYIAILEIGILPTY